MLGTKSHDLAQSINLKTMETGKMLSQNPLQNMTTNNHQQEFFNQYLTVIFDSQATEIWPIFTAGYHKVGSR